MKTSALLIVDVQNNVVAKAHERSQVIANINKLVNRAREAQIPVIWVQHSSQEMPEGSNGWEIVPELNVLPGENIIHKIHGDSFENTNLKSVLDNLKIERLIVAGAQTDACIRATIHGSFTRGYDTVLVADAHTTEDLTSYGLPNPKTLIDFTNTYWTWQSGPGKTASVVKTEGVQFK